MSSAKTKKMDNVYSYQERFVVFLDILGFSDHIERSVLDPFEIEKIISALELPKPVQKGKLIIGEVGDISESDHKITQFSDCVVISTECSGAGLLNIVDHVERIAFNLLKLGFLCRGGIAKGLLFHEMNTAFGPAFLKAYKLECEQAKYPRVILSEDVKKYALSMSAGQGTVIMRKLRKCADDFYMVHVLRLLAFALEASGEVGEWEMTYINIKSILQNEISRLSRHPEDQEKDKQRKISNCPTSQEKVKWFNDYFEQTVPIDKTKLLMAVMKQQQIS